MITRTSSRKDPNFEDFEQATNSSLWNAVVCNNPPTKLLKKDFSIFKYTISFKPLLLYVTFYTIFIKT
jgi:hypothetical protein